MNSVDVLCLQLFFIYFVFNVQTEVLGIPLPNGGVATREQWFNAMVTFWCNGNSILQANNHIKSNIGGVDGNADSNFPLLLHSQ